MADYSNPKPIDPIAYRPHAFLQITCQSGRRATFPMGDFARFHRLPGDMAFYELIARLRCGICGDALGFIPHLDALLILELGGVILTCTPRTPLAG